MANLADLVVTVDTTEALAKMEELGAQVDKVLAKLERCKALCGECRITISGPELAATLQIHTDRAGRVLGK